MLDRPGTYLCECEPGFTIVGEQRCEDVNECLLNNGHGPCQVCRCIDMAYSQGRTSKSLLDRWYSESD